jgi:hypothetical protein
MNAIVGVIRLGDSDRVGRLVDVNDDGDAVVAIPGRGRELYAWSQEEGTAYVAWVACEACGIQVHSTVFDDAGEPTSNAAVTPTDDGVWRCLECYAELRRGRPR